TCFTAHASKNIAEAPAPFTGNFRPEGSLATINNGQNPNGTWVLKITDHGTKPGFIELLDWSITLGNNPAKPLAYTFSYLPIVSIQTSGTIEDTIKTEAYMRIVNNIDPAKPNKLNDKANVYDGKI